MSKIIGKKKSSYLQDYLPIELLHLILQFYTNKLSGLIKFQTICKQFKEVSSHSLLWLSIDLSFYAPHCLFRN